MTKRCRLCGTTYYDTDYPFSDYGSIEKYLEEKVYFQCSYVDEQTGEQCSGREWDLQ